MRVLIFVVLAVGLMGCGKREEQSGEMRRLTACVKASSEDAEVLLEQAQRGEISLTMQARQRLEMVRGRGK